MSTSQLQFKRTKASPAYWRLTFDNPPINMLGPEAMIELQGLVGQFENDPDLRVVVFDSADPDFFIAHFDIARAADTPKEPGPTGCRAIEVQERRPNCYFFVTRLDCA